MEGDAEMQRRFAYALRAALAAKDWKPPDLARALGRDPSTADRWVKDGGSVPSLLMTKVIADALGVRPEFLYDPPPVPDYPLSEYMVRQATPDAVQEGAQRARRRQSRGGR